MDWTAIEVETETGSMYKVVKEDLDYYLYPHHIPSQTSKNVNGEKWKVKRPDIPQEGLAWLVMSYYFEDMSHPDRIPGGGKLTSPVKSIRVTY
jgi:hypothetical protein